MTFLGRDTNGRLAPRAPSVRSFTLRYLILVFLVGLFAAACTTTTQHADLEFAPPILAAAYPDGDGPMVAIDAAHHNYHTADLGYAAFAQLLRRDGFRVSSFAERFTPESLAPLDILVVSNALNSANAGKWELPNPSAFLPAEIAAVREWVEDGGALLLVADHMPFPGAAEDLARAFGVLFMNGYAAAPAPGGPGLSGIVRYDRASGSLLDHAISKGRNESERVDHVVAFGGQAFRLSETARVSAIPLLRLPAGSRLRLPWRAGRFDTKTASVPADELLQGVVLPYGKGRLAVFGEAAMFSAQRLVTKKPGREPSVFLMGMNDPAAGDNAQFVLNVVRWLSDLLN